MAWNGFGPGSLHWSESVTQIATGPAYNHTSARPAPVPPTSSHLPPPLAPATLFRLSRPRFIDRCLYFCALMSICGRKKKNLAAPQSPCLNQRESESFKVLKRVPRILRIRSVSLTTWLNGDPLFFLLPTKRCTTVCPADQTRYILLTLILATESSSQGAGGVGLAGPLGPLEHTDEQLSSRIRFIGHTGRMTRRRRGATICEAGRGGVAASYISTLLTCQRRLWKDSRPRPRTRTRPRHWHWHWQTWTEILVAPASCLLFYIYLFFLFISPLSLTLRVLSPSVPPSCCA